MTYKEVQKELKAYYKREQLLQVVQRTDNFVMPEKEKELKIMIDKTKALLKESLNFLSEIEQYIIIEHYTRGKSWQILSYQYGYSYDGLMSLNRRIIKKIVKNKSAQ